MKAAGIKAFMSTFVELLWTVKLYVMCLLVLSICCTFAVQKKNIY